MPNMPTNDPRLGLPSGSNALADALCPGRWRKQREWDEQVGEAIEPEAEEGEGTSELDRDAEAGKRIHRLYAGEECLNVKPAERQRAEMARQIDQKQLQSWKDSFDDDPAATIQEFREQRWWYNGDDWQPLYSGQTDAVWIRSVEGSGVCHCLMADLKGLWGYHDPAPINQQLRRYIALLAVNVDQLYGKLMSVWAYMNQPAKTMEPKLVLYTREEIDVAVFEMQMEVAAILDENAPRIPGPTQCFRCRGKLICPEFITASSAVIPVEDGVAPPSKEQLTLNVEQLPAEKLGTILRWRDALGNLCDLAKAEALRRLKADPASVPGWKRKPNSSRSKIDDVPTLQKRLEELYKVGGDEFLNHCKVSKESIETMLRGHTELKGKALFKAIEQTVDGITVPIPVSDSLVQEGKE